MKKYYRNIVSMGCQSLKDSAAQEVQHEQKRHFSIK